MRRSKAGRRMRTAWANVSARLTTWNHRIPWDVHGDNQAVDGCR